MHFVIFIADSHVDMFMDIVHMFIAGMQAQSSSNTFEFYPHCSCRHDNPHNNNCTKSIPADFNTDTRRFVTFGGGLTRHTIPDNSIINIFDWWEWERQHYIDYSPRCILYTYSQRDLKLAKELIPNARIFMFDFCYSPALDGYQDMPKQLDASFYGGHSDRRVQIVNAIRANGVNVHYTPGGWCYGQQRTDLLNKSKVVLAIFSGGCGFNHTIGSRIFPAISHGAFVVAEQSTDEDVNQTLQPYCIVCPAADMPSVVKYWSTHDEEREALRAQFHQRFKDHIPTFDCSWMTQE